MSENVGAYWRYSAASHLYTYSRTRPRILSLFLYSALLLPPSIIRDIDLVFCFLFLWQNHRILLLFFIFLLRLLFSLAYTYSLTHSISPALPYRRNTTH